MSTPTQSVAGPYSSPGCGPYSSNSFLTHAHLQQQHSGPYSSPGVYPHSADSFPFHSYTQQQYSGPYSSPGVYPHSADSFPFHSYTQQQYSGPYSSPGVYPQSQNDLVGFRVYEYATNHFQQPPPPYDFDEPLLSNTPHNQRPAASRTISTPPKVFHHHFRHASRIAAHSSDISAEHSDPLLLSFDMTIRRMPSLHHELDETTRNHPRTMHHYLWPLGSAIDAKIPQECSPFARQRMEQKKAQLRDEVLLPAIVKYFEGIRSKEFQPDEKTFSTLLQAAGDGRSAELVADIYAHAVDEHPNLLQPQDHAIALRSFRRCMQNETTPARILEPAQRALQKSLTIPSEQRPTLFDDQWAITFRQFMAKTTEVWPTEHRSELPSVLQGLELLYRQLHGSG